MVERKEDDVVSQESSSSENLRSENVDDAVTQDRGAILLIVFSLVSAGIGYASSILVARILGHEGFQAI